MKLMCELYANRILQTRFSFLRGTWQTPPEWLHLQVLHMLLPAIANSILHLWKSHRDKFLVLNSTLWWLNAFLYKGWRIKNKNISVKRNTFLKPYWGFSFIIARSSKSIDTCERLWRSKEDPVLKQYYRISLRDSLCIRSPSKWNITWQEEVPIKMILNGDLQFITHFLQ